MAKSVHGGLSDNDLTGKMVHVKAGDSVGNLHDGKSDVGVIVRLPGKNQKAD